MKGIKKKKAMKMETKNAEKIALKCMKDKRNFQNL